ncbi:MAG: hypothetical protein WB697_21750 [Stellaceae bacterium]
MPGNPRKAYRDAERRFPVRVRIAVPQNGLGRQLGDMYAWLDELCGKAGWTSAPAGLAGIVNDAVAFYFDDTALAQAFVNRFCCGYRPIEVNRDAAGAFSLRREASPPCAVLVHKTP